MLEKCHEKAKNGIPGPFVDVAAWLARERPGANLRGQNLGAQGLSLRLP